MDHRRIEDQCYRAALDEAIRSREVNARFYRGGIGRGWVDRRAENLLILRELRAIRRTALRIAGPIMEREDGITAAKDAALRAGDHHAGVIGADAA